MISLAFLVFFSLGSLLAGRPAVGTGPPSKVTIRDRWFVDDSGRVRIFHGVNSVSKSFPWYKESLLNETYLDNLQKWGFNIIRLGTMWSGLEVGPGYQYNRTYLEILGKIIENLSSRGIYTFLDMHQDGLSSRFQQYDGIPRFLIDKLPEPKHPYPWPFEDKKYANFPEVYITGACSAAFQDLYNNTNDILDHMAKFWQEVAKSVKGYNSVLGYELINEPWGGDIYQDIRNLIPKYAGKHNLLPFYDKLNEAIREVDKEKFIFYEPVTFGVFDKDNSFSTGFDRVPGGDDYRDRSVLSYHWYCFVISAANESSQYPAWEKVLCDNIIQPLVFEAILEEVKAIGGTSLLSEFGICHPNRVNGSVGNVECFSNLEFANKYLQSWTYWDTTDFYVNGVPNPVTVSMFSQTYAQAVAGTPLSMSFDHVSADFTLTYTCNPSIKMPTEIYVPPHHYRNGYSVEIGGPANFTVSAADQVHVVCRNASVVTVLIHAD